MAGGDMKSVINVIVKLSSQINDEKAVYELTAAFRKLRNKCAEGASFQNEIASYNLVDSTFKVLRDIMNADSTSDALNLCLLVGLQMIANLLVNNKEVQTKIWEDYQKNVISCVWYDNPEVQNCAVMILYNVFRGHLEYILFDKDVFFQIIYLVTGAKSEFAIYLIQLYISKTRYVQEIYHSLAPGLRLILIDVILDYITNEDEGLGEEMVRFFIEKFLSYSENFIAELEKTEYSAQAYETVRILDLLSSIAGNETDLKVIQNDETLLVSCIKLLKTIHNKSKEPGNNLSIIQKLSELNKLESQVTLQEGLSFGVKANIIRLIGNLCWKNRVNQNKVKELEAIPPLLDCCNIDGRNPFILQWTILAIRNLCDNNQEIQKFIASVGSNGAIDFNKMREMGILMNQESDENSVSIAALEMPDYSGINKTATHNK